MGLHGAIDLGPRHKTQQGGMRSCSQGKCVSRVKRHRPFSPHCCNCRTEPDARFAGECAIAYTACVHTKWSACGNALSGAASTHLIVVDEPELASLGEEDVLLVSIALAEEQVEDGALHQLVVVDAL